jgi:hypothetical protein
MMRYGRKRNAKLREEEQEGPHNLQEVWQAKLPHPREAVLGLRLRQVPENQEIQVAVEDRGRQEKEVAGSEIQNHYIRNAL